MCKPEQLSAKALNYAQQMTPYEKRFHSLQQEYRIVIRHVKDSVNEADITQLRERRIAIIVKARNIINKFDMRVPNDRAAR